MNLTEKDRANLNCLLNLEKDELKHLEVFLQSMQNGEGKYKPHEREAIIEHRIGLIEFEKSIIATLEKVLTVGSS